MRVNLSDDAPLIDDYYAVAQAQHFVQFSRYEQDGCARIAQFDQLAMNELCRPDVNAARRLRNQNQSRLDVELARDDQLLLIAARQRARGQS